MEDFLDIVEDEGEEAEREAEEVASLPPLFVPPVLPTRPPSTLQPLILAALLPLLLVLRFAITTSSLLFLFLATC